MATFRVTYVAQTTYEADVTLENPNPSLEELEAAIHDLDKNDEEEVSCTLDDNASFVSNVILDNFTPDSNISEDVTTCQKGFSPRRTFIQSIAIKGNN